MAKRNLRKCLLPLVILTAQISAFAQLSSVQPNMIPATPPIEPGVSLELARWRAARYSDVRYKLNLTLEKMSPVLKGTMEIRVNVKSSPPYEGGVDAALGGRGGSPIILDWRKIKGHEDKSVVSNVTINGRSAAVENHPVGETPPPRSSRKEGNSDASLTYAYRDEHLVFSDGVVIGENVIKLDFTSPILTSGSAITRYVDKEDGSEYLYSLFVPSDASTAFPVFDQPDLKARFTLTVDAPEEWEAVSNTDALVISGAERFEKNIRSTSTFRETKPISTYVFSFAIGDFTAFVEGAPKFRQETILMPKGERIEDGWGKPRSISIIYVRRSQAEKFKPHAAEVFRLNREAVRYFEEYFDYKFPFPKYDLVLIPEFPFGGMEHAGATFLKESSIIFPQEPTKNDHISRATLIFHEAAHQWFGDTVTMRWFDDLWLKEGFATFTAYKAMERILPEMNAWKVFYERVKQAAYQTDSTKGTTPIYQEIPNLSAAKSAYGAIVYNKAPAFLRQAEFYLGEDKFRAAVRSFLKKQEFGNAGWEDLVREFEKVAGRDQQQWAKQWVTQRGLPVIRTQAIVAGNKVSGFSLRQTPSLKTQDVEFDPYWTLNFNLYAKFPDGKTSVSRQFLDFEGERPWGPEAPHKNIPTFVFPNYQDYGYGIFLLDEKSREYVLRNTQNEKDPFLRSMMWGALWDSVREGELDPRVYVETVVKVLSLSKTENHPVGETPTPLLRKEVSFAGDDESTTALLLSRVGTAMNYYIDAEGVSSPHVSKGSTLSTGRVEPSVTVGLRTQVEDLLIERMRNAETLGQRITYYRAFLNIAASENAKRVLKEMLTAGGNLSGSEGVKNAERGMRNEESMNTLPTGRASASGVDQRGGAVQGTLPTGPVSASIPLKTKDKFDIVTRLLILGDADGERLLAELEKTETGDDAKRYAYAARAGIATTENKAKYWNDFVNNKEISESWIEAAFGPWNSIRHSDLMLPYLERALKELPNHKRNRKIFFVNGWLGAFIGGQRSEEALNIINKFLSDNATLDKDLRLKILENADVIERAVKIREKF